MSDALSQSRALHEAVARYRVAISRMLPTKSREEIAANLTLKQARALQAEVDARLRAEEPQWTNRMCRSLAEIELIDGAEVASLLGYGPDFSYEAAVKSVADFLQGEAKRQGMTDAPNNMEREGLQQVEALFELHCLQR
jgi:hypothetical protein